MRPRLAVLRAFTTPVLRAFTTPVLCALTTLAVLGGCAPRLAPLPVPSPLASSPPAATPSSPVRTFANPPPRPTVSRPASSPPWFPEDSAVTCAGRPSADQIIALLRAKHIIDTAAQVTTRLGPLCAGSWQYTVLGAAGREQLQVVSQGPATALVLVTAGTDVCTAGVRAQAPPGIITAAHCGQ